MTLHGEVNGVTARVQAFGASLSAKSGSQLMRAGDFAAEVSKLSSEENAVKLINRTIGATTLPSGLTSIGDNAFRNCTSLALTALPSGLTSINSYAFYGCTSLALTALPSGLTTISSQAFYGCTGLTSITFKGTPSGTINGTAFSGCTNLTVINVPWTSGAIAGAPWGATNATINYNYTP